VRFRPLIWILIPALLLVGLPAAAAPKVGKPCTKAGITKNFQGKKFTCIVKGRNFVWNKGIKIKLDTAAPVEPIAPATGPARPITLDNLDPNWTFKVAHKLALDAVQPFDSAKLGIRFVLGPNVSQARVDQEKAGIDRITGLWSSYFLPDSVRFIYVSPQDGDWAEQATGLEKLQPMIPPNTTLKKLITTNECMFALGGRPYGIYTNIQCLPDRISIQNRQTGPHEYTHFVQFHSGDLPGKAACWVVEGMATFYGNAIGFSMDDPNGIVRNQFFNGFAYSYGAPNPTPTTRAEFMQTLRRGNSTEIAAIMRLLEPPGCSQSTGPTTVQIGYLLGGMAWEALVASFGQQKVVDFMKDHITTQNWKVSFANTYGLSVEEFYQKLAPYFASQANW
jgi:hypothetical protein